MTAIIARRKTTNTHNFELFLSELSLVIIHRICSQMYIETHATKHTSIP